MNTPVGTAARLAGQEARHAADLHRARSALTAWMQQQQQQQLQPYTGPSTITDIQPSQKLQSFYSGTRASQLNRGTQLPDRHPMISGPQVDAHGHASTVLEIWSMSSKEVHLGQQETPQ